MTFTEIVAEVQDRLGLTSPESATRIGRKVNMYYKRLTADIGLQIARPTTGLIGTTSLGVQTVTFTGIERIDRLYTDASGTRKFYDEITFNEVQQINPVAGTPRRWAVEKMGSGTVTVRLDALPQDTYDLKVDGLETAATLSGSQVPQLPESYHDALVEGAYTDELRELERPRSVVDAAKEVYEERKSALKFFVIKSGWLKLRQGGATVRALSSGSTGSVGGSTNGGISYTQTGLITFDRDPAAPFAVSVGSAVVANLDADKVDGYHAADLIALMVQGPGSSVDNHVAFFNGATGKVLKDSGLTLAGTNTGDVTLAGQTYITVAGQVLTLAQINLASQVTGRLPFANLVAATGASKIIIGTGAGSFVEGSLGTGLTLAGSTLNAVATKPFMVWTALGNQPPASAYATPDTRNAHPVLDFDGATDEEAVFGGVLSPDYQGGGLTCETYWAFTSATSGNLRVQAAIERIDASSLDIDADSFASFNSAGGTAPGTSGQVIKVTVAFTSGAQMDSLVAGEAFRLKIRRDADGTSGTDDIVTDAELLRVVLRES